MKYYSRIVVFLLFAATCSSGFAQRKGRQPDNLFQISTLNKLLLGEFEGKASFREVMRHGDFGLGTFAALDGEMVAVDGEFYQIRDDGIATLVSKEQLTPFVTVSFFTADDVFRIDDEISCTELYSLLQDRFDSNQSPYAIKISGYFEMLTTRSVPAQKQPYPSLIDALLEQVKFDLTQVDARLAGFWFPDEFADINVAGFHFHAITEQLTGGHVLDCMAHGVEVEIDTINQLQIQFTEEKKLHPPVPKPGHTPQHNWPPNSHW